LFTLNDSIHDSLCQWVLKIFLKKTLAAKSPKSKKPAKKKSSPKWDLLQGNLAEGGEKEVQHK